MSKPSGTPRTDKHVADIGADGLADGDFARQLESELATARDSALEEAAKMCDEYALSISSMRSPAACAAAIRALKGKPSDEARRGK